MAPGKQPAFISGVRKGAHLHGDAVQPQRNTVIQHGVHTGGEGLGAGRIQHGPFQIAEPHAAVAHGLCRCALLRAARAGGHACKILPGGAVRRGAARPGAGGKPQRAGQRQRRQFFHWFHGSAPPLSTNSYARRPGAYSPFSMLRFSRPASELHSRS